MTEVEFHLDAGPSVRSMNAAYHFVQGRKQRYRYHGGETPRRQAVKLSQVPIRAQSRLTHPNRRGVCIFQPRRDSGRETQLKLDFSISNTFSTATVIVPRSVRR